MSPSESMAEAKLFASKHLSELAIEIIDWKRTGLLYGGAGGLLREMAQILGLEYHSLQIAESIVSDLALVAVAAPKPEGKTCKTCRHDTRYGHVIECETCARWGYHKDNWEPVARDGKGEWCAKLIVFRAHAVVVMPK